MNEKFAVYVVLIEDDEDAFRLLRKVTVEHRLVQDDINFLDGEVVVEEYGLN